MKKLIFILTAFVLTSCYQDLGNYDYNEIPDITIEEVPEYVGERILFQDTLEVTPVVGPVDDVEAGNYNYYWSEKQGTGSRATFVRFYQGKDLVYPINKAGRISLKFEVENKKTGITAYKVLSVDGVSEMSSGMYILKETSAGDTEIDMVRIDGDSGDQIAYHDLVTSIQGAPLSGAPVTLDYWGFRKEDFENARLVSVPALRVVSNKDLMVVNTNDFDVLATFDDLFLGDIPQTRNIQNVKSINGHTTLLNDGKVYSHSNLNTSMVNGEIKEFGSNRFLPKLNGDYHMDPSLSWPVSNSGNVFLAYDTVSARFKVIGTTYSVPKDVREYPGRTAFRDPLDADLLFMDATATGAYAYNVYALMQKRQHPDTLMLLDMNAQSLNYLYLNENKRDILPAADYKIDDATVWSVHQHRKVIYFAIGDQVWKYDTVSKTEELVLTLEGEEITFLEVANEWYTVEEGMLHRLEYTDVVIGSQAGGQYNLRKYNMSGDNLEAEPYFMSSGVGKIKDYVFIKPEVTPFWMRTIY